MDHNIFLKQRFKGNLYRKKNRVKSRKSSFAKKGKIYVLTSCLPLKVLHVRFITVPFDTLTLDNNLKDSVAFNLKKDQVC